MHAVETNHPATRIDAWAVNSAHCQAHYQIVAEAEPDVVCRVLNYFALQFLTPQQVTAAAPEPATRALVLPGLALAATAVGRRVRLLQ